MKILLSFLTIAVIFLTGLQGLVPMMPLAHPETTAPIVSAVLIYSVLALTAWKQFASDVIQNKSLYATALVALLATVGGLNDFFNVLPMSPATGQWLRFGVTVVALGLNVTSKALFSLPGVTAILIFCLPLSSCKVGDILKKDCHVTGVVVTGTTQQICLRCDSLSNSGVQLLDSVLHLKFETK